MNERLSAPDEELYERVVLGELEAASVLVRNRAAASPALARALAEWASLRQRMASEAEAKRAQFIEQALLETQAEDREYVRTLATPLLKGRKRLSLLRRAALAVAAAALLLFAVHSQFETPQDTGNRGFLGVGVVPGDDSYPQGKVQSLIPFVVDARVGSWYRLHIVVSDRDGRELARSPELRTLEWHPSPAALTAMESAQEILWQYEIEDASQGTQRGGPYRAVYAP